MGIARQSPPSPELKVFSDRLQKAIDFKKIDLAVLAKDSEYKPDDIRRLLAGMREPSMKKLMLLADSLDCSVDYLLGLTSKPLRASVDIEGDTDASKPQSSERGQTSGHLSGKAEQFMAMMPELLESDIELLMHIAGFLIERKEERLAGIVKAVTVKSSEETETLLKTLLPKSKNNDELDDDDFDDDDFDDDDFWDDVEDDEFEEDAFEEDIFEDDDVDFDDFDDFDD